jgi:hypothetical protein
MHEGQEIIGNGPNEKVHSRLELISKVISWNGVIKSPNWKLPTIHSNLYEAKDAAGNVIQSDPLPSNYIHITAKIPDTIKDAIWALNVLNCFKNIVNQ